MDYSWPGLNLWYRIQAESATCFYHVTSQCVDQLPSSSISLSLMLNSGLMSCHTPLPLLSVSTTNRALDRRLCMDELCVKYSGSPLSSFPRMANVLFWRKEIGVQNNNFWLQYSITTVSNKLKQKASVGVKYYSIKVMYLGKFCTIQNAAFTYCSQMCGSIV